MAIGDTDVELQFTNIVVNVPIVVGIQNTGVQTEIFVRYGIQRFPATLGVDYSLVFPVDLLTFQLTPTQSLMDKITAAGGTNVIFVQRVLPLTSDFDYDNAFVRQKLVDEFNRVWMTLQQQNYRIGLASPVTSWNSRVNDVFLYAADLTGVGGALLDSPHFTGIPTAPTAAPGENTNQIATDAFVNAAVNVGITQNAVTSFDGRQGNVNLLLADVTGVGGAPANSPAFTGNASFAGPVTFTVSPTAPTPPTPDSSTKLATTAYVQNAVAAVSSGVVSWNARVGVVTMTLADITGIGGAAASAIPVASVAIPVMDGVGIAGVATTWARGDHVHPTDTSRVADTGDTMTGPLVMPNNGTAAATSFNFGTAGTGVYGSSTNVAISTGGSQRASVTTTAILLNLPVSVPGGTAAATSLNFGTNGTGFYGGTSAIGFSISGTVRATLDASALTMAVPVVLPADPTVPLQAATKQYVDGVAAASGGGFRNILRRNGGLEVWQRGAGGAYSLAIAASGGSPYTADGWYLFNGVNQACVVSQVAGIANGSQFAAKIQRNAGQTGVGTMYIAMPLDTDELFPMLGQFVRLSAVIKAGANWSPAGGNISLNLYVGTGAPIKRIGGFTGETNPLTGAAVLTTTATRFQVNSTVFVPTTARQAEVLVAWTPVGTAGADDSFSIDDVQLEIVPAATGYVASDFERLNFAEQVALCQRHFYKTHSYSVVPQAGVNTSTGEQWGRVVVAAASVRAVTFEPRYLVEMRATPSILLLNPVSVNNQAYDITSTADCSATAAAAISTKGFSVTATGPATGVVGDRAAIHFTADAGI